MPVSATATAQAVTTPSSRSMSAAVRPSSATAPGSSQGSAGWHDDPRRAAGGQGVEERVGQLGRGAPADRGLVVGQPVHQQVEPGGLVQVAGPPVRPRHLGRRRPIGQRAPDPPQRPRPARYSPPPSARGGPGGVARRDPCVRVHQSRKPSAGGTGRSRLAVQPDSGGGKARIRPRRPRRRAGPGCRQRDRPTARRPHRVRDRAHDRPLRGRMRHLRAQVHQHRRDVDRHRAGVVAGPAQRGRVRQGRVLGHPGQLRARAPPRSAPDTPTRTRARRSARTPGTR